jgi:hypothetical protein
MNPKSEIIVNKFKFGKPEKFIEHLKGRKLNFKIRETTESTYIECDKIAYSFNHSKNFPTNKLFMFNLVKKDALKWIGNRPEIFLPPKHNVTEFNVDYDDSYGVITATDLNHAYWRIAFIKGIISESTYNHGLKSDSKALIQASISVLGREIVHDVYEKGYKVSSEIYRKEQPKLKAVYKYVRFYCYQLMYEASLKLGSDFDCWKTDCIYYRKTNENVKKMQDFFSFKNLIFKQLDF